MSPLRRQAMLTVAVVAAVLVAIFLAARMMYVSDRDALLFSVMVLAIGLVSLRIASLAERERAREAAEATRRQMIAAVSHDLRTPLASLRLLVEAVDDEIVDEETRRRYLATMRVNVNSLSTLIDDLFELSRIEAGDIEWSIRQVELGMLVDETVAAMQPEAGAKGVEIRTQLSERELRAQADPEKVQRVLFNLIRNAIRHTPADGTVTVRATGGRGEVEIEVADTGDGIPAAERDRVFDAFFRGGEDAARGSDGAGLGLAVSRAIVERHGGRIWLAPAAGGTSVRFSLPR
ncbi:MAG TPA: HAMP domain-containing sensor histidine kinase [Solirubrobacterales bacterium]|nr:HAMP domain-containing sensor histidine kinase [Solirubrobacterales bacterium]